MKHIQYTLISFLLTLNVIAQNNVVSIHPQTGDTVYLTINDPQGAIQWQISSDEVNWTDISGATSAVYTVIAPSVNYYRAMVSGLECGDIYTEAVFISSFSESVDSLSAEELDLLILQCHLPMRAWYGREVGCDFTEVGTDLYTWGSDNRNQWFADYDSTYMTGETPLRTELMWNELYRGLTSCNAAIHFIEMSDMEEDDKVLITAEVKFLRGFYLWHIAETWGGALYTLDFEPFDENSLKSVPVDTMYAQIVRDLKFAESNLPDFDDDNTQITLPVAKAFLARIYLTMENYSAALQYANELINDLDFGLYADYDTLWYIHNRQNSEVIYALDNTQYPDPYYPYISLIYGNNYTFIGLCWREGGNQSHLIWEIRYAGLRYYGTLRDVMNGRGFNRYMPTKFFINLFNYQLDQRYYGSFKSVWYCNNDMVTTWPEEYYIDGVKYDTDTSKIGDPLYAIGDTSIVMSPEPWTISEKARLDSNAGYFIHPDKGYTILDINDVYNPDGTPGVLSNRKYYYPITRKFNDTTRATAMQEFSSRNVYIIRLAEMYLIAAEAAMEIGNSVDAYNYLLVLANMRSYTGDGAGLLATYGINTGTDIDIDFILDERARELAAEQLRWFDLKRTGKLVERVAANNPDVKDNIQEFHNVRPISWKVLDMYDWMEQNQGYILLEY